MKDRVTLEEYVEEKIRKHRSKYRVLQKTYREIVEGKLRIVDPNPPRDFLEYLSRPDYAAWLWTGLVLTALAILSIPLSSLFQPIIYVRYVLGSVYVLFLPGYFTVETLYPRGDELSSLERLALSIGLSLALVPLVGLILNFTPWGIRLEPILASLTSLTVALAFLASWRKYLELKKNLRFIL